jgi:hypothetical protein
MIHMTTRTRSPQRPEQLALLAPSDLPVQFRLDQRTRQLGLAHVAAIRQQLAARYPSTEAAAADAVVAPRAPITRRQAA